MKPSSAIGFVALAVLIAPRAALAQDAPLDDPAVELSEPGATESVPPPPATTATPPPAAVDGARAARLEAWLEVRASDDRRDAIIAGVTGIGGGVVSAVAGAWIWADQIFGFSPLGRPLFGSLLLALGGVELAFGIAALAAPPVSVQRLARWRLALEEGMTPEQLAAFEGELRADADAARQERWLVMAGGAGLALAGAGIGVLAGTVEGLTDLDRLYGGLVGGAYGLAGLVLFLTSFIESPAETAWNQYQRGEGPRAVLSVRPVFGAGSLGLAGTF